MKETRVAPKVKWLSTKLATDFHDLCVLYHLNRLWNLYEQTGHQEQGRMIHLLLVTPVSGCWKRTLRQDSSHPSGAVYAVEELRLSWTENKWRLGDETEASRDN